MNTRLEAFCDGVFAIALTLLVIDIKLPSMETISSTNDLWIELQHLAPSIFAFLLSFIVIFITWVNHHAALKLVKRATPRFIYANGVLLLSVVFIPFPTSLLGEFILTDHASPAVILYCGVCGLQAVAWMLMCFAALKKNEPLGKNEKAIRSAQENLLRSKYAIGFYTICAIAAIWIPLIVAVIVAVSWILWLVIGIKTKEEE